MVRNGLFGLLSALALVGSVSMGLPFQPGATSEFWIDFLIASSVCLAVGVFLLDAKLAVCAALAANCCLGIALGGHAATRESPQSMRAEIGDKPVLIQFQARLLEKFKQPDHGAGDLLDVFQKSIEPPRFRALAELIETKNLEKTEIRCGTVRLLLDDCETKFAVGDVVRGIGWLMGVDAPHNPGEAENRVRAFRTNHVGSIFVAGNPLVVERSNELFNEIQYRAREWVDNNLLSVMRDCPPSQVQTLVLAMTTGRQLPGYRTLQNTFAKSGLSHFLAISGFNVAILFGVVWILMELFHIPWPLRGWILMLTGFLFLFIVNVETSVFRAGIAGILVGFSVAIDRGWKADGMLAVAIVITIVCDPWDAWNPGFQLSYAAVLALRYGSGPILRVFELAIKHVRVLSIGLAQTIARSILSAVSVSVAAWLVSTPITEAHFGSCSIWSVCASVILAPIAALITILASISCAVGCVPGADFILGWPLYFLSEAFLYLSTCVLSLPLANIRGCEIAWWIAIVEIGALFACFVVKKPLIRYSSLVVFTAIFVTTLLVPISRTGESETDWDLRMTSISVGDGSAHVVETPSSCSLFDAGTISRLSGGSSVIVPALAAIGCLRFDAVFISHPHLDHFSAIPEIAEAFDIDRVFATESFLRFANTSEAPGVLIDALRKKSIHIEQISSGDEMTIDGFVWSTLHPRIGYQSRIVNDGSLVFQIRPEADRIVVSPDSSPAWLTLCGDAQNEAIATVLASSSLTASLAMELPHHGALSDGLRSFVHKLNPRILLQSTGNRRFQFDRIWSVVENMDRGVTCRDGALRTTWFRCPPETGATCRISLERWSGERWVEMVEHTVR